MNFIAENLAFLRKDKQYTQADISGRLDVPVSTYASWEYGKAEPSVDNIVKICEIFVITPSEFLMRRLAHAQGKQSTYDATEQPLHMVTEPDPPAYNTKKKATKSLATDKVIQEMLQRISLLEENQQQIMKQIGSPPKAKSKKGPKSPF